MGLDMEMGVRIGMGLALEMGLVMGVGGDTGTLMAMVAEWEKKETNKPTCQKGLHWKYPVGLARDLGL
jgi:hypothetical protein